MLSHVMKQRGMYSGGSAASGQLGLTEQHTNTEVCHLWNLELCNFE